MRERCGRTEVLLVEDNPADVQLAEEALQESSARINLNVVPDGAAAIDYLERRGPFVFAVRPHLILLDLNLPVLDGRQVLRRIKRHDDLKMIPVVVLTSSDAEEDIAVAYQLHANCYVTKPSGFDAFVDLMRSVENFWISVARIPA